MRDRDDQKPKKEKWKYKISSWLGRATVGEWVPESVATTLKRTFEHHTKGEGWTKRVPVIVRENVEELVYCHHGYRPRFEGEKQTRKAFYFRGARVWRG